MRIVFLSNYFNHHQKPLADALAARADFAFVATAQITPERLAMGWGNEEEPDYVIHYDRDSEQAEECLAQADVVIAGSAPQALVRRCIERSQLVLRYSERPLKKGLQPGKFLPRLLKWHWQNPAGKPIYMLCASGYTASDYARFGLFRGKAFRWGYFPAVQTYESPEALLEGKQKSSILWVGRFLDWKHPDDAVRVAARLRNAGLDFEMNLIGSGQLEPVLRELIAGENLQECVHLLGAMKPEEVRRHMERSEIFLFTSDRQEGWGAVLNEAMNSGCAVVASHEAGVVPFLLRHGENGLVYRSGHVDSLADTVSQLLINKERTKALGIQAYETMLEHWNAEVAAQRLLVLAGRLLEGKQESPYADGPCSMAQTIREDWYPG